tara:strand:- start:301 stop:534 length:234 start_codon:yes stop_codon:yes gene_type:complete
LRAASPKTSFSQIQSIRTIVGQSGDARQKQPVAGNHLKVGMRPITNHQPDQQQLEKRSNLYHHIANNLIEKRHQNPD